jgi:uncharacterized membrane protein
MSSGVLLFLTTFVASAVEAVEALTIVLAVGALLLAFGLQWLRKAILRASGFKPLHDEAAAFVRERREAEHASPAGGTRIDWRTRSSSWWASC